MKVRSRLVACGLLPVAFLLVLAVWGPGCAAQPPAKHVVLITIDGFPAWLLDDPRLCMPTLRRLMKQGAAVKSVRATNPSITWPTHTSIATGCRSDRHGVLLNGIITRQGPNLPVKVEPSRDRSELVKTPTLYDAVHKAGLTTADINWPCTRSADTLDDSLPDAPLAVARATPRLREELIEAGILPDQTDAAFMRMGQVARDEAWTSAACHVIRARKPNLLLFHLLNVDALHHAHGPGSWAGLTALAYADTCLQRILDALDDAGIRDSATVIVMADHGFTATPKSLRPNVLLRQAGLLTATPAGKIESCRVRVLSGGGVGLVYATAEKGGAEDLQKARHLLQGKEGIAEIIEPARYGEYHLPTPQENPQMADLVLVAKDGYAFNDSAAGEQAVVSSYETRASLGYHGHVASLNKMSVPLVMWGAGVKAGARIEQAELIDVAPTVARLLGAAMDKVQGRVLDELLAAPAASTGKPGE